MTYADLTGELAIDAYRLFLNRAPANPAAQAKQSFDLLISNLFWSAEFQQSPRSKKSGLGWPEAQYFVARDKKVIYCPIRKVACSFLKGAMVDLSEHPQKNILKRSIHMLTDHVRTGMQLSDYNEDDAAAMINDPEMLRFAVLRDPAHRLLSGYLEKFVVNRLESNNVKYHTTSVVTPVQTRKGMEQIDFDLGITFRDYVEFITEQDPATLDPHWRPQSLYLADYDWELYTLDMLDELVARLTALSGVKLDNMQLNKTDSGNGEAIDGADTMLPAEIETIGGIAASSFITPDLDEKIKAFFADDYALINGLK